MKNLSYIQIAKDIESLEIILDDEYKRTIRIWKDEHNSIHNKVSEICNNYINGTCSYSEYKMKTDIYVNALIGSLHILLSKLKARAMQYGRDDNDYIRLLYLYLDLHLKEIDDEYIINTLNR